MGFSKQEYWSGLPFPSPGALLCPGSKPRSPDWQADSLPLSDAGSPPVCVYPSLIHLNQWFSTRGNFSGPVSPPHPTPVSLTHSTSRAHLAMLVDIVGCHHLGRRMVATVISWAEATDVAKPLPVKDSLPTKNFLTQNVNRAEIQKRRYKPS